MIRDKKEIINDIRRMVGDEPISFAFNQFKIHNKGWTYDVMEVYEDMVTCVGYESFNLYHINFEDMSSRTLNLICKKCAKAKANDD